jgi:hypothetical protein
MVKIIKLDPIAEEMAVETRLEYPVCLTFQRLRRSQGMRGAGNVRYLPRLH